MPLGRQAALELRHHAVYGGEVLQRVGGQRAVELLQRLGGRKGLRALDERPLELPPQVALELAQPLLRHRVRLRQLAAGVGPKPKRAPDALDVHSDHAGALALAAERGDREPRHVAHLAIRALADRVADALAQLVDVHPLAALEALLAQPSLHRLAFHRAEEEAVEDQLEHAPVLLRLGERRRERLAEILLLGPA